MSCMAIPLLRHRASPPALTRHAGMMHQANPPLPSLPIGPRSLTLPGLRAGMTISPSAPPNSPMDGPLGAPHAGTVAGCRPPQVAALVTSATNAGTSDSTSTSSGGGEAAVAAATKADVATLWVGGDWSKLPELKAAFPEVRVCVCVCVCVCGCVWVGGCLWVGGCGCSGCIFDWMDDGAWYG
jgi:hypothetical protein